MNYQIDYWKLVKEAAKISWRKRFLWWFGFLIILGSSLGNIFQYSPEKEREGSQSFLRLASEHKELIVALSAIFLVLWATTLIVGMIAKGGLIKAINKIIDKKETGFRDGMKEGKKYFWKIFWISFIYGIFLFALVLIFSIPIAFLFFNGSYALGIMLTVLALVIFIPVVFILTFAKIFGFFYAIIADLSVWEAVENGYALIQKNITPSALVVLTFILIGATIGMIMLLVLIPAAAVFFLLGFSIFLLLGEVGIVAGLLTAAVVLLPFFLLTGSVYQVFSHSLLILFFREIASPKNEEKIVEKEGEREKNSSVMSAPDALPGN